MTPYLRHVQIALLGISLSAVPFAAAAQNNYQFKNEGIFGCNQTAGANASAGTLAAIGGVYVPVNDAAVTLNTGILVYKECVLRPLQDRLRESAMSALLKRASVAIETGREGNKRYVVDPEAELLAVRDRSRLTTLTGDTAQGLTPIFRDNIVRWSAATYQQETRAPESLLKCPYDDINARIQNQSDDPIGSIFAMTNPVCIPHLAALYFEDLADARDAQAVENQKMVWDWGRGFYALTDNAQDPFQEKILTPSSVVQESFQQILGSSVRQLESADDIGEMISALYAGVTTQIISDNRGFSGIMQSRGGQPAYIDQVARDSSQGVIGAAVNAALSILNASREIEGRYLASMEAIAANLTQAINQLRNMERACWELVVPRAQNYATQSGLTLDPNKINTSTSSLAFSQQVIDSQIAPLANAALTNVQNSRRALGLIDQLIAGVTNTASQNAQRIALQQLDTLVAERELHTRFDAENALKQRDDVASAMQTLIQDTAQAWGDSPSPSTGWCNINNADIPRLWAERWKI
ncbi:hypothetical protein HYW60_01800 [Candidatus Kaiserbacteria bacterium]|nr:hypothetical protein [Candidatus Kaiserbacteria bacterium]